MSRRELTLLGWAAVAARGRASEQAHAPSEWKRYPDPSTEMEVYRLTDPGHTSLLPAYYNRALGRRNAFLLYACDRLGTLQPYHMDMRSGQSVQVSEAVDLDAASLSLLPDGRAVYFAGRALHLVTASARDRTMLSVAENWERCAGASVTGDGAEVLFGERQGERSRLRAASTLPRGAVRTIVEAPFAISDPVARPGRAQVLYREGEAGVWLVNSDGAQNRRLKLAAGKIGPVLWAADGKTVLYLRIPEDRKQLNEIREFTPDANTDRLVARTSQFVHFGANRDTSVFVGASRNAASPTLLLLLRVTRREFTLCEHKASDAAMVAPIFSPDAQRIFFLSDRHGKPAIYCLRVDKLVEKIEAES